MAPSDVRTADPTGTRNEATADPSPGVGDVDLGSLRRVHPISRVFGFDRGRCIDRYYIDQFLQTHAPDIRGRVLEVADNEYTRRWGGSRVTRSDVLHAAPGNRKATIVADLASGENLPSRAFDCLLFTQTLQHIYDTKAALRTIGRILAPGGVFLVTVPGISQISRYDMDRWGDFWRFTTLSLSRLLEEVFPAEQIAVTAYGNVLTATAFLHGLASEELSARELDFHDADYELLIAARAQKAGESA